MTIISSSTPDVPSPASPIVKVDAVSSDAVASSTPHLATVARQESPAMPGSASSGTVAEFSNVVKLMTTKNTATINEAKVNDIKQAIAEGRFQVNAQKIAEGMFTFLSSTAVVTKVSTRS